MRKWYDWILALMPQYWWQIYPRSKPWDDEIRRLMDCEDFIEIGEFTARLGPHTIWIESHPFASFRPYSHQRRLPEVLPNTRTVIAARRKLLRDMVKWMRRTPMEIELIREGRGAELADL